MTENHGKPIIIKDVAKWYRSKEGPVHALAQTSLNVGEGEFVSIVGPSGCGKSTLMMIVSGLVPRALARSRSALIPLRCPIPNWGSCSKGRYCSSGVTCLTMS